jgi:hypothetical protein
MTIENAATTALPHLPQHRLHGLALVFRQGFLGRNGIADVIALDR